MAHTSEDLITQMLTERCIADSSFLMRRSVSQLMQQSVAFVQHSIVAENGDSEGTPVAVLEAQAAGLSLISTYHAGIPDVFLHNETGLLVEEKDVEGMSTNMLRILQEDGLAKKMGTSARKRVKENFPMERHLGALAEIINSAIAT